MKCEAMMQKDRALYADMLDALSGDIGRVVYDSETAVLIRFNDFPQYLLAAEDDAEGERLLDSITEKDCYIVVKGYHLYEYAASKGLRMSRPCTQVMYEGEPMNESGPLEFRHPSEAEFAKVAKTYHMTSLEELRECFESDEFFGGYIGDEFVAYAGVHGDGSMGMLHVFEEHRGKGYAKQMVAHSVNNRLKLGRIPYGQVFIENEASLGLQRSMGMRFSNDVITWAFVDECNEER